VLFLKNGKTILSDVWSSTETLFLTKPPVSVFPIHH